MPLGRTSKGADQDQSISPRTFTRVKNEKERLAEEKAKLEAKVARIKAMDDLTASQFSLVSQAVEATTLSQADKDQVLRNIVELCTPQAKASIGAI